MADRYWVGGTGTWDTTSTTNWSATSGGSSGASVPTAADNVIFDSATTYTVSLSGALTCLDITVSAGTVTFANGGTSRSLTISGSMTLVAGTLWNTTATLTFNTTGSKTLTTNGVQISGPVTINASGGTITLGSALTIKQSGVFGDFTLTNGTFSTSASNYNLTGTAVVISANSNTKALNLNGSTLSLVGSFMNRSTGNFTLSAGTSTISFIEAFAPSARFLYSTSNITFYNVVFSIADGSNFFLGQTGYTGSMTFNNLTFDNGLAQRVCRVYLYANATVNGTFSASGTSVDRRYQFFSDTSGTSRTITAATVSISNADFKDITGAGAGSWTGTSIGNFGGNSGITFTAAKTVYYKSTTMGAWSAANWATTSGGTASINNLPLPQDTAVIDNNSGTGTLTIDNYNECNYGVSTIDCSARTTAFTLNINGTINITGDLKLCSAMTVSGTGTVTNNAGYETPPTDYNFNNVIAFLGTTTQNVTSSGKTLTAGIAALNPNTSIKLVDAMTLGSSVNATLYKGTIDLNGQTLTIANQFYSPYSNARTLAFGAGNITLTGTGTIWDTGTITNMTVTGTPTVNVTTNTATSRSLTLGSASESNSVSVVVSAGTGSVSITGNSRNLDFTGFSGSLDNQTRSIYGNFTASAGMTLSAGANEQTFAATSGSKTITSNGQTFDFPVTFNGSGGTWVFQDNLTIGSTRILTHTNGTVDLNGKSINVGSSYATAAGTKNLTFNGGTLVCANSGSTAFNNAQPTGFTTTAGTGTGKISLTSISAKTFVGGGSTYNCTLSNDGAGALTITGNNTFTTIANGVQPTAFNFAAGSTTTLTNWNISGTVGNLVTVGSSSASQHTLSKASGTVSADYLAISYSNATGGAVWDAGANSTNGGNNSGWIFAGSVSSANFFFMFN